MQEEAPLRTGTWSSYVACKVAQMVRSRARTGPPLAAGFHVSRLLPRAAHLGSIPQLPSTHGNGLRGRWPRLPLFQLGPVCVLESVSWHSVPGQPSPAVWLKPPDSWRVPWMPPGRKAVAKGQAGSTPPRPLAPVLLGNGLVEPGRGPDPTAHKL